MLPKAQDMTDLQARVDSLFKENGELRNRVEEGEALRKELEELKDWIMALEKEVKSAWEERDKTKEVARKIHAFVGYLGNIVNKACLYDQCAKQPKMASRAKVIWCNMVNYSTKIEKLLRELRTLFQPVGIQLEPVPTPAPAPAPTPIPVPTMSPEMVTLLANRPDPTLQEEIPEINTKDITSLETWAVGGKQNMATLTTRSRGTNLLGNCQHPDRLARRRGGR